MTKQMSKNEALERIEFGIRQSCPEANGSNIGECNECWRFPCNDMKALLVLRDLKEEERPHGEWIDLSDGWQEGTFMCSSCQMEFVLIEGTPEDNEYNFCPNCGADMRKGGDEK